MKSTLLLEIQRVQDIYIYTHICMYNIYLCVCVCVCGVMISVNDEDDDFRLLSNSGSVWFLRSAEKRRTPRSRD
jgi:hypothetical protein